MGKKFALPLVLLLGLSVGEPFRRRNKFNVSIYYQAPPPPQSAGSKKELKFWLDFNREIMNSIKKNLDIDWLCSIKGAQKQKIRWLHIPKTGSTFFTTLYRYACSSSRDDLFVGNKCPTDFACNKTFLDSDALLINACPSHNFTCRMQVDKCVQRWAVHIPYLRHEAPETFVSMFRSPSQRILSAYYFGKHIWGGERSKGTEFSDWRTTVQRLSTTPYKFAATPGITSCTTKMLNHGCFCSTRPIVNDSVQCSAETRVLDQKFLKDAVTRLLKFAFVGIQDLFHASICLFHAKFDGPNFAPHAELAKFNLSPKRPGGRKYRLANTGTEQNTWNEQELETFIDPLDEPLFSVVLFRFLSDINQVYAQYNNTQNSALQSLQSRLLYHLSQAAFFPPTATADPVQQSQFSQPKFISSSPRRSRRVFGLKRRGEHNNSSRN